MGLWTTDRFLRDAFVVIDAWDFRYSTTTVWAKGPMGHGMGGALRICTEYLLFARRGQFPAHGRVGRAWGGSAVGHGSAGTRGVRL